MRKEYIIFKNNDGASMSQVFQFPAIVKQAKLLEQTNYLKVILHSICAK